LKVKDPVPLTPHSARREPLNGAGAGAGAWALHRPGGRDVGIMAVAVIGISLSAPLTTLLAAPMLALAFWRNLGGAAVLLPVLLLRERSVLAGLRPRDLTSSVVAGLFLAAHFAAWLPSLSMTTVAASTALVTTTPVWTALAARVSGVRLPAATWAGLMLAVVGAALIAGVDVTVSLEALAGDGLALLGALCAGGYVLAGARARQRLSTSAYAVVCYSVCAVAIAVAAVAVGNPLVGFAVRDWVLIAAITVCAQLLGHTLFNLLLSSVGPTMVSLVILLEVPGALLFALVLLQQVPPLLALPGVALVVVGVGLVVRASRPAGLAEPGT
jgi:drug/metabolite transporter (DMT)-like permease